MAAEPFVLGFVSIATWLAMGSCIVLRQCAIFGLTTWIRTATNTFWKYTTTPLMLGLRQVTLVSRSVSVRPLLRNPGMDITERGVLKTLPTLELYSWLKAQFHRANGTWRVGWHQRKLTSREAGCYLLIASARVMNARMCPRSTLERAPPRHPRIVILCLKSISGIMRRIANSTQTTEVKYGCNHY